MSRNSMQIIIKPHIALRVFAFASLASLALFLLHGSKDFATATSQNSLHLHEFIISESKEEIAVTSDVGDYPEFFAKTQASASPLTNPPPPPPPKRPSNPQKTNKTPSSLQNEPILKILSATEFDPVKTNIENRSDALPPPLALPSITIGSYNLANFGKDLLSYCRLSRSPVGDFILCPLFLSSLWSSNIATSSNTSLLRLRERSAIFPASRLNLRKENDTYELVFATQCSSNRLSRVLSILDRWQGPISVAVFVENSTEMREVVRWYNNVTSQESRLANLTQEYLDIHFVIDDPRKLVKEYPINYLRNVAMNWSLAPNILVADADAMPSHSSGVFKDELQDAILFNANNGVRPSRALYLVPAFELTPLYDGNESHIPHSKQEAIELYERGKIMPMHNYFRPAYMPTDYDRWVRVDYPYQVPYQLYFEPYYITSLTEFEPARYDERFTNYGKNKAQQNYELQAMGYKMFVLPSVFVIDMGHPEGENWRREFNTEKVFALMNHFRLETDIKYSKKRWHDRSTDLFEWLRATRWDPY